MRNNPDFGLIEDIADAMRADQPSLHLLNEAALNSAIQSGMRVLIDRMRSTKVSAPWADEMICAFSDEELDKFDRKYLAHLPPL